MLYINNPQAVEAILDGRRRSDGQHKSYEEFSPSDEAIETSSERQILLPRLSALLTTT